MGYRVRCLPKWNASSARLPSRQHQSAKSQAPGYVTESIRKAINTTTSVYNPAHNQNPMMIAAAESVMQNGNESTLPATVNHLNHHHQTAQVCRYSRNGKSTPPRRTGAGKAV